MKKRLLFLLPMILLTSCSENGITVEEANTIIQGFNDYTATTYSYEGNVDYNNLDRDIAKEDIKLSKGTLSEAIGAPLVLNKETFLEKQYTQIQYCLISSDSYQKVIIKELEDGIQFYSRGSNFTLNLKHASESDGSAEISARWDITLTYNEDGLLVEEIGETLNYHTNDALKAAFKCTYTYA